MLLAAGAAEPAGASAAWLAGAPPGGLQVCAQNVLDVATHLVAPAGRDAQDYTNAIDQLAALGVLPEPFAARLRGLAGLRNILVYAYLEVDAERLRRVLTERLGELAEFARLVQEYLQRGE